MEHVEVEEKGLIHRLYRDLIHSGLAFGAERWVGTLQRVCERHACLMVNSNPSHDHGGGNLYQNYFFPNVIGNLHLVD